ncbi:MAG: HAD family phosphatase [Candidatus Nanohaloarchaea archaeon]|nr:HAD family phosphatase [Candidatus Nanohaloarchaea archaeon]
MPEAVIFDMDGVIVDSERYWKQHEDRVYDDLLPDGLDASKVLQQVKGMNFREIYDFLRREYGTNISRDEFIKRYHDIAETIYQDQVSMMDGFPDLVQQLRDSGARVGLASSSPPSWIEMVLERFGLEDAFDTTLSAEQIDTDGKPQPGIYLEAAERLGVDPEDCTAVEDSPNGIMAAKQAGMRCIAYLAHSNEDDDLSKADLVATDPNELTSYLLED